MTTTTVAPTIKLRTNIYRGCQRCGGVLRLERDLDSTLDHDAVSYACLQCGRHTSLADVVARARESLAGGGR